MERLLLIFLLAASWSNGNAATCQDTPYSTYPYCNYKLDIPERVKDLISRMKPEDKVSQLGTGAGAIHNNDIDVPGYQWWSEALHGVAGSPGVHFSGDLKNATSFPQVIGLGATFNMTLIREMAKVISTEARAFANKGQAGLTFFAPNINIYRDPRWGRGQETPGEDPYLTSQYVTQFAKGMQEGEDPRYLKVVATCKHFAAYDLENWNGTNRFKFDAKVTDQDLVETYFPAFEACVKDGNGGSIMCSYNAVNGVPSCANDLFNNKVVRDEWGFEGYIVSDCGAVGNILGSHHYTNTPEDTVKVALRGGCDLNCGGFYQKNGMDAYNKKTITDADLDLAMTRLFTYRMKLGMFDPPDLQPYMNYTPSVVSTPAHQNLALQAARESIVLLTNDGALPLDNKKTVALIGPNSDATGTMQGNYKGTAPYLISPLMGLTNMKITVNHADGCNVACSSDSGFSDALDAATKSDIIIAVVGLDEGQESEGHDRTSIMLPGKQGDLLQQVREKNPSKPMIVVAMSGGPVDLSYAKDKANAVLWTGYPGQSGGQALAEILYGIVNPSGRLPMTFYPGDYVDKISFGDMGMRTPPGRTYKFYSGTAVYEFGCGLSYTTFSMEWSSTPLSHYSLNELSNIEAINYQVKVTNTGKVGGQVSVLAYVTSDQPDAPKKELFAFQKIYLDHGQSQSIFFGVEPAKLFLTVNKKGKRQVHTGDYRVTIGDLIHTVTVH